MRGTGVRPTSDRVRETLFDILQPVVEGEAFLDLFAGSGAVGIEALSRGAASVLFVERNPAHVRVLQANLEATGLRSGAEVWCRDAGLALDLLARRGRRFGIVFLDPPYGQGLVPATLPRVGPVLETGGLAIAEHHRRDPVPPEAGTLRRFRETTLGETVLSFYRKEGPDVAHQGDLSGEL